MSSILMMVFLELADIGIPPKVIVVNEANGFISLVRRNMLEVSIEPLGGATRRPYVL